jgi:hypothetical protein
MACGPRYSSPLFGRESIEQERQLQQHYSLPGTIERVRRGFRVVEPILIAAGPLCSSTSPSVGARFASMHDFPRSDQRYAASVLHLGEIPRVVQVIPGFGGKTASLLAGDLVSRVNGVLPRSGAEVLEQLQLTGPNRVEVSRDRRTWTIEVESTAKCDYEALYPVDSRAHAYTSRRRLIVHSALMDQLEDDHELALRIAHELAHSLLLHQKLMPGERDLRGSLRTLAGMAARRFADIDPEGIQVDPGVHIDDHLYRPEFELEADYVGLYLVELAGFDMSKGTAAFRSKVPRIAPLPAIAAEIRERMGAGDLPPTRVRPAVVAADLTPSGVWSELPDEVVGIAEYRGRILGRAMQCRVPETDMKTFEQGSHQILRETTFSSEQMTKALVLFDAAVARAASEPGVDCHTAVVEFYKG